ncbi:MAG: ASCH domain-containing protein [Steroidobacteraceae bacterium]
MKAISLWQPWASAIPLGLKQIETRGWYTHYRGPLAIHAAKRWTPEQREFAFLEHISGRLLPTSLPLGALVATANMVECWRTDQMQVGEIERRYGNYAPGRFAWVLRDVVALPKPISWKGAQGFFNVPDELFVKEAA